VTATYAIGDIQGCYDSLQALLSRIDYRRGLDRLWLAGDLVNRGPRSLDTLRWARDQGDSLVAVLGNHDLHLLACAAGVRRPRRRDTFQDVLTAPDRDELLDWLRRRPLVHREGSRLLVHAGLLPPWTADAAVALGREVEAELRGPGAAALLGSWSDAPRAWSDDLTGIDRHALVLSALVTIRCVDRAGAMDREFNGAPAEVPADLVPWFAHPARRSRDVRVVCGHWAALGLHLAPDVAALDTGCVWGGELTAVRLSDDALWQQAAVEHGCNPCRA
jgi:bis(5'-nucleosyl)-tetraphosphatase (symmetrical)